MQTCSKTLSVAQVTAQGSNHPAGASSPHTLSSDMVFNATGSPRFAGTSPPPAASLQALGAAHTSSKDHAAVGTPPQATKSPAWGCRLGRLGQCPTCHVFVQIMGWCNANQQAHPDACDWVSQPDLSSGLGCTGQPDMAPHRHRWFSICQQRVTPKLQQIQLLNAHVVCRIFFSSFVCVCEHLHGAQEELGAAVPGHS